MRSLGVGLLLMGAACASSTAPTAVTEATCDVPVATLLALTADALTPARQPLVVPAGTARPAWVLIDHGPLYHWDAVRGVYCRVHPGV